MHVPASLQRAVNRKVRECFAIAAHKHGKMLPTPTVTFDVMGEDAGRANLRRWAVRFNPVLLVHNRSKFINDIVPHECAHLITEAVYPEAHTPAKGKRKMPHGKKWASVMISLGAVPKTFHQYDLLPVHRASTRTSYVYQCDHCHKEIAVSKREHERIQRRPHAYFCKCNDDSSLVFKEVINPDRSPSATRIIAREGSKLDACLDLYAKHSFHSSRADLIAMFIAEAKCTDRTARTYYYLCRSRFIAHAAAKDLSH